jgi:hypothetical protein
MLSMGRTAVFEEIRLGRLRSVKRGRSRLVPVECLREYVARLLAESDAEGAA